VSIFTERKYLHEHCWVKPLLPDFIANKGLQSRDPILREKTNNSVSDPPAAPADTSLSSIFDKQTESSDGALKDIESDYSGKGKEKADKGYRNTRDEDKRRRDNTATDVAGIRDSSKRTADRAGLNEGSESHRSEKAQCAGR